MRSISGALALLDHTLIEKIIDLWYEQKEHRHAHQGVHPLSIPSRSRWSSYPSPASSRALHPHSRPPHPRRRSPPRPRKRPPATRSTPTQLAACAALGLPVTIQVSRDGKPVAAASIVVKTDAGVEMSKGQTDAAGTLKLEPGDYSITATAGEEDRQITAKIAATTSGDPIRIATLL